MPFFFEYLKQRRKGVLVFVLFCLIFICMFALYRLPIMAVAYPALLCTAIGMFLIGTDYRKAKQKHGRLLELQVLGTELMNEFPDQETLDDRDYQEIIRLVRREQADRISQMSRQYSEMIDYYTVWAHQIKTPIASMRLNQQQEDSEFSRQVAEDLQRIEQYVEMVLAFLRLDSDSTDYVFKEYCVDDIIRPAVKKFSTQFIRHKIKLVYKPIDLHIITDEKWLSFVIEQVLSNALKYTRKGAVSIHMENKTLCISDTGIGIAPEDLPRVFEKGYTGYNGRTDKKASGLGLYLCHRICNQLGHRISIISEVDEGTTVCIDLEQTKLEME